MKKIPLILDLDTGIDDAVALVFANALKKLDLQLITTVYGNINIDQVVTNTLVIAEDTGCNVKICKGEEKPIILTDFNHSAHGKNGLANYTHPTTLCASNDNYLDEMHHVIQNNRLTYIVACGPLTNLAKFIERYPEDNNKVQIVLVTGLLENNPKAPYLNFNLAKDIEAVKIVLKNYKNIVFVPSDMGHLSYIKSEDFHLTANCGKVGKILADLYPYHLDRTVKNGAAMHDLCGVLWLSHPKLFKTKTAFTKLRTLKKGSFLEYNFNSLKPNSLVTTNINTKKMHKLYYKTLKSLDKNK